jgi:hypothetical protein
MGSMKHNPLHKWELMALWTLAVIVVVGSIYVATLAAGKAHSDTYGIVIGGLMAALPMLINAMRNIGQAQAMQSMAEQLGNSAPITDSATGKASDPLHVVSELDLAGAEIDR